VDGPLALCLTACNSNYLRASGEDGVLSGGGREGEGGMDGDSHTVRTLQVSGHNKVGDASCADGDRTEH
jgi:hypothetical protein